MSCLWQGNGGLQVVGIKSKRYFHAGMLLVNLYGLRKISKKKGGIIHYVFALKPWYDASFLYGGYFWKYALETLSYMEIKKAFSLYKLERGTFRLR